MSIYFFLKTIKKSKTDRNSAKHNHLHFIDIGPVFVENI